MTSERLQKIEAVLSKRQNDITVVLENINDSELLRQIENELRINSEFKKEYEELKRTFNFLNLFYVGRKR